MADAKDQKVSASAVASAAAAGVAVVGAVAQIDWKAESCLSALPETARGYGTAVYYSSFLGGVITYGSGNLAYIRNVKNPAICDTFQSNEHKGRITVVQVAPNGEWVASGDDTGTVLIWGSRPGQHNIKLNVKVNKRVWDLAWSSDSQRIVAVGDGAESKAKVFDWSSGNNLGAITGHAKTILSCAFKPQRPFKIVTCSEDMSVSLHEGPPFKWVTSNTSATGHSRFPSCVRFAPSGNHYISVGADSKVFIYESKDGKAKLIEHKDNHKSTITSVAWNGDGKKFLTCAMDKTVKLWSFDEAKVEAAVTQTFTFAAKPAVSDMQVSVLWAGDDTPLSVSLSGAINYLDESNPKQPKRVVQGHMKAIRGFGLDKASGSIYTSDDDGAVAKWDIATGNATWFNGCAKAFDTGSSGIPFCAPNSDGTKLVTAGMDDKFRFHDTKTTTYNVNGTAMGGEPTGLATAKKDNGLAAVTLAQEKLIVVREAKVLSTTPLGFKPNCVAFSSDDKELAVGGADSKVRLYTLGADGKIALKSTLDGHVNKVLAIAYSPDSALLASCDSNRQIIIWKNGVQQNNTGWTFHNANPLDLAWPSNNSKLATCASDQDIIIWSDLKTFEHTFQRITLAHPSGVEHVAWINDEKIVSTGADRCMRVWSFNPKK